MSRVLVAIPNFNNRKYILEAIYSAKNQAIEDLDIVVFDNASTDDAVDVVRSEFGADVTVFVNAENIGGVGNHNLCLDYALKNDYDFVKFLSSDDILIDGVIKKEIELLAKYPHISIVISNMIVVDADLKFIQEVKFSGANTPEIPLEGGPYIKFSAKSIDNIFGGPSGFLVRVNSCKSIRFDSSFKWIADLKFAADLLERSYFANSGCFGFYYRRHPDTDSKTLEKRIFLKTIEYLRYSWGYGGGLVGILRAILRLLKNINIQIIN